MKVRREYADYIDNIVSIFKANPSIAQIKKHLKTKTTFSHSPTSKDERVAIIKQIIVKQIIDNEAVGGEISLNILK